MDVEFRKKKMTKFDSLKPLLNLLETILVKHGMLQHTADLVVLDIAERLVTAGYGWDKILQYQSKGEQLFNKKLIPHIFMSKDELPNTISCEEILKSMYRYIEDWKLKLYDMISFNTSAMAMAAHQDTIKDIGMTGVKQEPLEYDQQQSMGSMKYDPPSTYLKLQLPPMTNPTPLPKTISYPIPTPATGNNTMMMTTAPPSPEKRRSRKKIKRIRTPSPSKSVSPSPPSTKSQSPCLREKIRGAISPSKQKVKMVKKSLIEDDADVHPQPSLRRYGVKEVKDVDAKTTFYKYEGNKKIDRSSSERKVLLDKVSAIIDTVNEEELMIVEDGIENKDNKTKEKFLNKESRTVTVIDEYRRPRSKSPKLIIDEYRRSRSKTPKKYKRSRTRSRTHSPSRRNHRDRSSSRRRQSPYRRRSWSRSPPRYRSPSPWGRRYRSRSRSWSPYGKYFTRPMWIAVSPVSIDTDYKVEKNSEEKVVVTLREQFNFPSNKGAKVRISKWTGKDCLSSLVVKPQVIELQEENQMELTVENPYYDRGIKLLKHDKIGCLSILSTPVPRSMRSNSPDRFQTSEARWVKVTHAVLHRKGQLDRIRIHPGKIMKIIATLKGAVKKYVGMEVLVTELESRKCPIDAQVVRIMENDTIGFTVQNRSREVMEIDKDGQNVACISVWAKMDIEERK